MNTWSKGRKGRCLEVEKVLAERLTESRTRSGKLLWLTEWRTGSGGQLLGSRGLGEEKLG